MSFAIFLILSRIPAFFCGVFFSFSGDERSVRSSQPFCPIMVFSPFFTVGKSRPQKYSASGEKTWSSRVSSLAATTT